MVLILFVEVLKKVLKSLKFELKNPAETLISIKHVIPMRDQISAQMSSSSIKYESLVHNFKDWFYFSLEFFLSLNITITNLIYLF